MTREELIAYLLVSGWKRNTLRSHTYEVYSPTNPALKAHHITIGVDQRNYDVMINIHDCLENLTPPKPFKHIVSTLRYLHQEYDNE